ncbi:hypothetical protein CYMTET_34593 [Cymbomonas tetramitiformis]|uniref:Uncharacterized protein n=1 Tax=Cymbomonas tetramitiformis TaxID=36881 RepID=A0AAE0KQ26_9CHLO|nr:hypothetical protein CYMTET_34593 [Cymbomonas tetramitiformis]
MPHHRDWFQELFGVPEPCYEDVKHLLTVDGEFMTSSANNATYRIGTFETPSLEELRCRGAGLLADLPGKLTGPACSICCGPSTAYRNYFHPLVGADGTLQYGQTAKNQVNNLQDLCEVLGNKPLGRYFDVKNGYTLAADSGLKNLNSNLSQVDSEGKERLKGLLRVGVHWDAGVTSAKWGTVQIRDEDQVVTQVFSSACAVAYSGNNRALWAPFASLVLDASYEATLWAAVINAHRHNGQHGSKIVYLTAVGGGVFGNSFEWIARALETTFKKFKNVDLDVRINMFSPPVDPRIQRLATET